MYEKQQCPKLYFSREWKSSHSDVSPRPYSIYVHSDISLAVSVTRCFQRAARTTVSKF